MYIGKNYVDGEFFTPIGEEFDAVNPSTEEIYGKFVKTSKNEAEQSVFCARQAFSSWKKESRVIRSDYFDKLAQLIKRDHELLVNTISIETGKNLNESHAEVIEALHMCQYAASMGRQPCGEVIASELASKDSYVIRKPRGVVAVISPWNFPLAIGSFWSAAPSIVEGNTVVHKPSELTPMINQIVAELYHEAGFPKGVYNLIHGDGETGKYLVNSNVDVILFTGSSEVAQEIKLHCATTYNKSSSSECGSKSATIVFEDGDSNLALDVTVASAFKLSGQRCVSSGRILVERSIFDDFCRSFVNRVQNNVSVCNPFTWDGSSKICYGPLISKEHHQRVDSFNELVRNDSDATIVYDSANLKSSKGYFMKPFVYKCEWLDKIFLKNEVFGPHVALIPFNDLEDAIRIYNDTDYGLSLGAVTNDFRKHRVLEQECTTGMLYINGGSIAAESHLPFSSWKKSGYGASASATWKAVTHTMSVTINYEKDKVSWAQGMK